MMPDYQADYETLRAECLRSHKTAMPEAQRQQHALAVLDTWRDHLRIATNRPLLSDAAVDAELTAAVAAGATPAPAPSVATSAATSATTPLVFTWGSLLWNFGLFVLLAGACRILFIIGRPVPASGTIWWYLDPLQWGAVVALAVVLVSVVRRIGELWSVRPASLREGWLA